MADRYPGKDFIPSLPLARCRPLAERLSVHLDPAPEALAKAARQATAAEQVARAIEQTRDAGLASLKRLRRERALAEARAASRAGPAEDHPLRDTP
jgi:hypothetical protein